VGTKWYKIDNAGKIFPTVWSLAERNSFRLSAVLKDEIDESLLSIALDKALQRFPTFGVRLRRGFFWYYLEKNPLKPIIRKDTNIFSTIDLTGNNGYLFSLTYYGRRLAIDIFHTISDGTGGLEFFKCILYYYFELLGGVFQNNGEILTNELEQYYDEKDDSFLKNYDKLVKKTPKEPKGYKITGGTYYEKGRFGLFHVLMNVDELKAVSKKYNATITEYLSACLLQSIYKNEYNEKTKKEIFNLFVAVNVRKYFNSKTLRNFALFIRSYTKFKDNMTFEEILSDVKDFFKNELTKEKMQARLVQNVKLEKNIFVRIIPLFIKKYAMRLGYKLMASTIDTMNFSNLGIARCPEGFENYVERFEFVLGASKSLPMNASSISYNNTFVLSLSISTLERELPRCVINQLVKDGIDITIETNDLEVQDEEM